MPGDTATPVGVKPSCTTEVVEKNEKHRIL